MTPTLDEQISEVKRELYWRRKVYPDRVRRQKMTRADADKHMRRMEAVLQTMEALKKEPMNQTELFA